MHDQDTVAPLAYTAEQAARALNISRSSIYNLIAEGSLKATVIAGRRLIPVAELQALLRAQPTPEAFAAWRGSAGFPRRMPKTDPAEFYVDWPLWERAKPVERVAEPSAVGGATEGVPLKQPSEVRAICQALQVWNQQMYWRMVRAGELPGCPENPATAWPGKRVPWHEILFTPIHPR